MPSRYAFLVGCNYPGTNAALRGCVNDVWGIKRMLTTYYGFEEDSITVMIDTDDSYTRPTGAIIKKTLSELVDKVEDGDILFFHFSGHGTQVPDKSKEEVDGKDEAICPADMNLICDDDFRAIFKPLESKPKVKLTFIADCCHSGSLIDHNAVVIYGPKDGQPPPPQIGEGLMSALLATLGGADNREFINRSLPFSELCNILSSLTGGGVVDASNVRGSLGSLFGGDSSNKIQMFMQIAQAMSGGGGADGAASGGGGGGFLGKLFSCLSPPMDSGAAAAQPPASSGAAAPQKPTNLLNKDLGILVTGCQASETSADACPSGDATKAHGALSNAIQAVVKQHHEEQSGQPLTYRNLVIGVRELLAKTGFTQNPCLECSEDNADTAFIVA